MPAEPKILLVDDEPSVRLVINRFLTASGFKVLECEDGADAVAVALREKPALILMDIEMPRQDGLRTLAELRRVRCQAPVILLTNVNYVAARVRGLETGADDYIGKPCDLNELLARVKALLRRASPPAPSVQRLRFGPLTVDLSRREATRGTEPVKLTRTEYALIEFLLQHRGQPVGREEIINRVWGGTDASNSHTFDTHIWRLRKKLGDTGDAPRWLRNLSGIGYVLECEVEQAV